ncbi:MAG: DUF4363 family protein [Oscillospiraceae bacterium]|nr:DUF4363 family protein [Oscillospiraceae bacterium]
MNRIIVSVIVLLSVVGIATFSVMSLDASCERLAESLDEIKQTAEAGDSEKAVELTENILDVWEKQEKKISLLIDHGEIDEIEKIIKSLSVYARQDNMERLEEKSSVAAERVRHIKDKEKVSPQNVF